MSIFTFCISKLIFILLQILNFIPQFWLTKRTSYACQLLISLINRRTRRFHKWTSHCSILPDLCIHNFLTRSPFHSVTVILITVFILLVGLRTNPFVGSWIYRFLWFGWSWFVIFVGSSWISLWCVLAVSSCFSVSVSYCFSGCSVSWRGFSVFSSGFDSSTSVIFGFVRICPFRVSLAMPLLWVVDSGFLVDWVRPSGAFYWILSSPHSVITLSLTWDFLSHFNFLIKKFKKITIFDIL